MLGVACLGVSNVNNLTMTEMVAILLAGIAGFASAVQAYVSWETRGEVSRAIVFAQRIDACSKVLASLAPFVVKAGPDARAVVAKGKADGRYSLPGYFYQMSSGNAAFNAKHEPRVAEWRLASAALDIVSPTETTAQRIAYFDDAITKQIEAGRFMNQTEMLQWLEQFEANAKGLKQDCRGLL